MTPDMIVHLIEILVIGAPLWWGAIRFASILKDFPPHRHDNGNILYPRGYEPGKIQPLFKEGSK